MRRRGAVLGLGLAVLIALGGFPALAGDAASGGSGMWAWGINGFGQLGDGTAADRHTPVEVSGPSGSPPSPPAAGHSPGVHGPGYWLVASDGSIFAYGDVAFYGSTGSITLNEPVVGMAATPDGGGYWLVASDGGIFAYGDAAFYGSVAARKAVVGMAATPSGNGYWLVTSLGEVLRYGDAPYYGSEGSCRPRVCPPVVGMARMPNGYWLAASTGDVIGFGVGESKTFSRPENLMLNKAVVGVASTPSGNGYWLVASDGGVFTYNAPFYGSAGATPLNQPVVGVAAAP